MLLATTENFIDFAKRKYNLLKEKKKMQKGVLMIYYLLVVGATRLYETSWIRNRYLPPNEQKKNKPLYIFYMQFSYRLSIFSLSGFFLIFLVMSAFAAYI